MKPNVFLGLMGAMALVQLTGCENPAQNESIVEVNDIRITHRLLEVDSDGDLDTPTLFVFSHPAAVEASRLINPVAGIVASLFRNEKDIGSQKILGHALPRDIDPLSLTGFKKKVLKYEKVLESIVLKETLIKINYEISYYYAGTLMKDKKPVGRYLQNIAFTPSIVKESVTHACVIDGKSGLPLNNGTKEQPIAALDATVSFKVTAYKLESCTITDSFGIEAEKGNVNASINQLSDCL